MRFLKIERNNRAMIEPRERHVLFRHCTDGMSCVTFKVFSEETIPILQAHGVDLITYEGEANVAETED